VPGPLEVPDFQTLRTAQHRHFAFWDNFDRRVLQPEMWQIPRPSLAPRWLEWYRLRQKLPTHDGFLQAARATILIDTLCWPAAWLRHVDERYIAPSLDLTVWFHREADSEWLLADARSAVAEAGLVSGTCQIWSEQRTLLATGGSQLMCVPSSGLAQAK
jgi:acyl-CoA thioesterase